MSIWLWRIRLHSWWLLRDSRKRRKKHCHKGYHKLHRCSLFIQYFEKGKKSLVINYLKCKECEFTFFATEEDKANFILHSDKHIAGNIYHRL